MSDFPRNSSASERIAQEAAAWILRTDRGLSPAEQDAFSEWLAADPRHSVEIARHRRHWNRLDVLAEWRPEHSTRPNPDLLAPPLRHRVLRFAPAAIGLAAAAAIALTWIFWDPPSAQPAGTQTSPVATATPAASQRALEDGSVIELNRDASITVDFSGVERRVTLARGEAHFTVAKDPSRPFVVRAQGIDVRAVGTAFNVRVEASVVEVLVTEGRVQLDAPDPLTAASGGELGAVPRLQILHTLEARQRAVVSLEPEAPAPQVATLTASEIERVLAWQHRLLDFTAAPISEIVAEFNRRNVVQLVVIDPELASIRVSAALRSDNVDGFVRLLEAGFGARAERRGASEILLRNAR